jgi:hypothetical protein
MPAWSLSETLSQSGEFEFDPTFSNSLGAEYYFGVSFLEVMGYWDPQYRFWTDDDLGAEAPLICCRIRHSLDRIGASGWQADAARQKLKRICAQC